MSSSSKNQYFSLQSSKNVNALVILSETWDFCPGPTGLDMFPPPEGPCPQRFLCCLLKTPQPHPSHSTPFQEGTQLPELVMLSVSHTTVPLKPKGQPRRGLVIIIPVATRETEDPHEGCAYLRPHEEKCQGWGWIPGALLGVHALCTCTGLLCSLQRCLSSGRWGLNPSVGMVWDSVSHRCGSHSAAQGIFLSCCQAPVCSVWGRWQLLRQPSPFLSPFQKGERYKLIPRY